MAKITFWRASLGIDIVSAAVRGGVKQGVSAEGRGYLGVSERNNIIVF
jgi:hypothetical protein